MVKCEVCGGDFRHITHTHLATHDLSTDEYELRFPWSNFQSEDYIQERVEPLRGRTQSEESLIARTHAVQEYWDSPAGEEERRRRSQLLSGVGVGHPDSYREVVPHENVPPYADALSIVTDG